MKNFLKILFSFLSICSFAQSGLINGAQSVEVGINNSYNFSYTEPINASYDKYKITYMRLTVNSGNVNNTGNFSDTDYSHFGIEYNSGTTVSINRPILFKDNYNAIDDVIELQIGYQRRSKTSGNWEFMSPITINYPVTVNRIFQPILSTPEILACCSNNISFSASQFGAANIFNWNNFSGGTIITGQGTSNITVQIDPAAISLSFDLTVGRSQNVGYTKTTQKYIQKKPRTANYTISAPPVFTYSTQEYICKSLGRTFTVAPQCGLTGVTWYAQNCTITGQGTLSAHIIPNSSIPNGAAFEVYGVANYTGGCLVTMPITNFIVFDSAGAVTAPTGGSVVALSYPANFPLQNASHWTFAYKMKKGTAINYSNGIFVIEPDVAQFEANGRTITVSACYLNVCNGQKSCENYQVFLPGVPNWQPYRLAANTSIVENPTVIIDEITPKENYVLYPNPTNGDFNITFAKPTTGAYLIIDSTSGFLITEKKFQNQKELEISLDRNLKAGLYLVKVISEDGTFTEKIILNNK